MEDKIYIDGVAQTIIEKLTEEITTQLSNRLYNHFEQFILDTQDKYSETILKGIKSETDQIKINFGNTEQNQINVQEQAIVLLKKLNSKLSGLEDAAKTISQELNKEIVTHIPEISNMHHEIKHHLDAVKNSLSKEIEVYRSKNNKLITTLKNANAEGEKYTSKLENEIDKLKAVVSNLESKNLALESILNDTNENARQLKIGFKKQINELKFIISNLETEKIRNENKIDKLNGRLISVNDQLETKTALVDKMEKQKLVLEKKLSRLQKLWEEIDGR